MIEGQSPKKRKPSIDQTRLSPADREAFERVAAVLQRPLSELYEGNSRSPSINMRDENSPPAYPDSVKISVPVTQSINLDYQQQLITAERGGYLAQPWTWTPQPSSTIFQERTPLDLTVDQWTDKTSCAPPLETSAFGIYSCVSNPETSRQSRHWSHEATADEPWIGVPTNFLVQKYLPDENIYHPEFIMRPSAIEEQMPANGYSHQAQESYPSKDMRGQESFGGSTEKSSTHQSPFEDIGSKQVNPEDFAFEQDWEEVDIPQILDNASQSISSVKTTRPEWSLIEALSPKDSDERDLIGHNSASRSVKWMTGDSSGERNSPQKPQRRGPFLNQQLRKQTSSTRKLKACVRCRMQKIRVRDYQKSASRLKLTKTVPD